MNFTQYYELTTPIDEVKISYEHFKDIYQLMLVEQSELGLNII